MKDIERLTLPTILMGTMIKNEAHALDRWWQSLCNLKYPKDNIKLSIIDDDSTDDSLEKLNSFRDAGGCFGEFTVVPARSLPYASRRNPRIQDRTQWWRVGEWNAWHNEYWFKQVREGGADHFLQVHGDVLIHPDALNDYLHAVTTMDKVGWVGSIGKNRGGRSLVVWKWRKNDGMNMVRYQGALLGDRIIRVISKLSKQRYGGFDGNNSPLTVGMHDLSVIYSILRGRLVSPLRLNELPKNVHFFECAFVGGCFLVSGEVLRLGCQYKPWHEEQAVPFVLNMQRLGYHALCSTLTPMVHINRDGSEERML
jgi:Glycosyl transferase family 2